MQVGDIVAANIEGVCYEKHAVGEVLRICGGAAAGRVIVRFSTGWNISKSSRDQIVTMENFRVIPRS